MSPDRWLVLVHQIPAKPEYLRVKVGRRLAKLGAVPIKNSVYVLPHDAERAEDLQWLLREIAEGGGEGTLLGARLLGGLTDAAVEELFRAARDGDCEGPLAEARALLARGAPTAADRPAWEAEVGRLRRRHDEIAAIDFFGCSRRVELDGVLRGVAALLVPPTDAGAPRPVARGRTWVTRRGIRVDRMASAWLIRRFIDPDARFEFVDGKGHVPEPGTLRFDMFDAEYTHEGDACTFEVLIRGFGLREPGLGALAEVVHDIDLKDDRYRRAETAGVRLMVDAIVAAHADDAERLARACALFDDWLVVAARGPA